MQAVLNWSQLQRLLKAFYTLTGLRTVVFDRSGLDILSYPPELPRFCRLIRKGQGGINRCLLCDQQACAMARKEQGTVIYPCHAGLIEMITPIVVGDTVAGYLLLSHIVQGVDEEGEWAIIRERCSDFQVDMQQLRQAYQQLPRTPETKLVAASELLSLAAKALYQEKLACTESDDWQIRINRFIQEHLDEDLSNDRLCREFSLSRTTLYHISCDAFGCGISEYISHLRIQRAMRMLAETDTPASQICQQVGIRDYNYFFRLFRRQTDMTPRAYRKQFAGQQKPTG